MARYVALLRGVNNIGTTRRVAMADLRTLFEELGFYDVRTLLNSGNVIFSAPKMKRGEVLPRIEKGVSAKLGLTARVTLLSSQEVAAVVRNNPFSGASINPSDVLVVVPRTRSELWRLRPLLAKRWKPESFILGNRVAYVWCANSVANSPLWPAIDRALGRTGTARNIATITKALALVKGARSCK